MAIANQVLDYLLDNGSITTGLKALLAVTIFYLYKYRSNAIGTHRRSDLKQPKGNLPLIGHLSLIKSIPLAEFNEFIDKQYHELGPVWTFSIPGIGRFVQINTPENLEYVLKTNYDNFIRGEVYRDTLAGISEDGIFTTDGAEWKYQRQLSTHIFDIKAFREYTSSVFVVEGRKVIQHLSNAADNGTVIDIQQVFLAFTMDTFGSVIFGETFGLLTDINKKVPYVDALEDMLEIVTGRIVNPLWKISEQFNGKGKLMKEKRQVVFNYAKNILDKRRREGFHRERKDIIQYFIEGTDNEGNPVRDEVIIDNIIGFTVAGRDTTAHALTWMFQMLLREGADEKNMERLYKEIDEVHRGVDPEFDSNKKLKFTEACFCEALRVRPVVPRNQRLCARDDVLPDGTKVYAGEYIGWSSYAMGRSEDVWGPDAKEYNPSRWINTEKPSNSKFNSFHAGPRVCLGRQFAITEALTLISMILQRFELKLEEPAKIPSYRVSLAYPMVGGLNIRVQRRSGAVTI
ncbi:hypothetical protein BGZ76_007209 [Entomortierella beljakovae]|nr:hypothetical protein BGZ76_007209 [Entomortierella beljakovae]